MAGHTNVLLITTDQQRFDAVGFMGNPEVRTPNLDRLAANGTVFERCYVTNPVCMPSRATLLGGQFPDANGVRRNGIEVPDPPWGLARSMRAGGYRTGLFGKTHFSPLRRDYRSDFSFHDWRDGETYYGFEERAITHDLKDFVSGEETHYHGPEVLEDPTRAFVRDDYLAWIKEHHPESYPLAVREGLPANGRTSAPELWTSELSPELHQSTWIADRTIKFVERHREEPFFAWCSFVDPHHPFNAPRAYRELYEKRDLAEPVRREGELDGRSRHHRQRSEEQLADWREHWREYRAQYYGMITLVDEQVGKLTRHLEESGLSENTLVIFTSDHGEMLGDHGLSRKGLFHYEPLIRVPLVFHQPGHVRAGVRQRGIVQNVDLPATILQAGGISPPREHQGVPLGPWYRGEREDSPRTHALVTNGGEGPHYDPWPELRTLVTERWKLQHYVGEDHLEIDDLQKDPHELRPLGADLHPALTRKLLGGLADATAAASAWGEHVGRW